jgi:hypothetical protein
MSIFRHPYEEVPVPDHAPREEPVSTMTITCAESGIIAGGGPEGQDVPCCTLADAEAWCAALRRWGAPDDLLLKCAGGLTVTLDVPGPASPPEAAG